MPQSIAGSCVLSAPACLVAGFVLVAVGCAHRGGHKEPEGMTHVERAAPADTNHEGAAQPTAGGLDDGEPTLAGQAEISIDNFTFNPETIEIRAGTRVVWVNGDDVPHTVRSTEDLFRSEALDTDDQFGHVFSEPGTYEYYCGIHTHMTGKVMVE